MALNTRPIYENGEFAQTTHISYDIVYGVGHQAWEWTQDFCLRPVLYPMIIAAVFKFLYVFYIDFTIIMIYIPHFLHVLLWQLSDLYLYKLVKNESKVLENDEATVTSKGGYAKLTFLIFIWCYLSNVFMPKNVTNTVEGLLLPLGLFYWTQVKIDDRIIDRNAIIQTVIVVVAFLIRPTSIVAWILPMAWKIFVHKSFLKYLFCGFFVAIPILLLSA